MASSKEYLDFVLDQLKELDELSYRKMMGEYLSRTTVYYMLRAEDFPAIALGSRRIVKREKLFEWINKHENASDSSNE